MNQEWTVFVGLVLILVMVVLIILLGDTYSTISCWSSFNSIANILSFGSLPKGIYYAIKDFMTHKTVFHVGPDRFTYLDAPLVCQALGVQLATEDQLNEAYSQGANWCNTGWMAGQLAGYPIQPNFMQDIKRYIPKGEQNRCGNIGINGGYYSNPKIPFGVLCYGKIPTSETIPPAPVALDARKLKYDERGVPIYQMNLEDDMKIAVIRDQFLRGDIKITPFYQGLVDTAAFKGMIGDDTDYYGDGGITDDDADEEDDSENYAYGN